MTSRKKRGNAGHGSGSAPTSPLGSPVTSPRTPRSQVFPPPSAASPRASHASILPPSSAAASSVSSAASNGTDQSVNGTATDTSPSSSSLSPNGRTDSVFTPGNATNDTIRGLMEVDRMTETIRSLERDKQHADMILGNFQAHDWNFIAERSRTLRESMIAQLNTHVDDVTALCSFVRKQKELSQERVTEQKHKDKEKIFRWRDSQLSVMFRTTKDFQTVYHIFCSVLGIFTLKVLTNEYFEESGRIFSFKALWWNFGGWWNQVLPIWLGMFAYSVMLVPIMWLWRRNIINNATYIAIYACAALTFIPLFGVYIAQHLLPVASQMTLICEQVRIAMKMHSFFRETYLIRNTPPPVGGDESVHAAANRRLMDSFSKQLNQFLLFMFVPTLIYRNSYPRTPKRRWGVILGHIIEVSGCIFFIYTIFATFCIPEFERTASNPGGIQQLVLSSINAALPSILVYLLTFFGLLHSWLNGWAELTRFADRLFYQDWWNCTDFPTYYRKWNMVVHDWLYNYCFLDALRTKWSRTAAQLLTFLWSAIVHEYIIAIGLNFLYPVMFFMFGCFGVGYVFVFGIIYKGSRVWNLLFWFNLIIGNGLLMVLYSREYYARHAYWAGDRNSLAGGVIDPSSWLPYSWQLFLTAQPQPIAHMSASA